jgi:hypothetical protein
VEKEKIKKKKSKKSESKLRNKNKKHKSIKKNMSKVNQIFLILKIKVHQLNQKMNGITYHQDKGF